MGMKAVVEMLVRGSQQPNYGEGVEQQPALTPQGAQVTAVDLPSAALRVAAGNSYQVRTTTAAAPVSAVPTTAALLGIWNGEPANGKSYVIEDFFAVIVAATAAIQATGILYCLHFNPATITTITGALTPINLRGNLPYRGLAQVAAGVTLDATNGVAAAWYPIGTSSAPVNTTQVGQTIEVPVNGRIIIPPGGKLGLTVISGATTATSVQLGLRWHEVNLPPVV